MIYVFHVRQAPRQEFPTGGGGLGPIFHVSVGSVGNPGTGTSTLVELGSQALPSRWSASFHGTALFSLPGRSCRNQGVRVVGDRGKI